MVMENKRRRDSFTKVLKRVAERIDTNRNFVVRWQHDLLMKKRMITNIQVKSLWVVGSYARGALVCGDLDLVVDISFEGTLPLSHKISKPILGHSPDVRLYIGTPDKNDSGIAFPEARLVWSTDNNDWATAIDSIHPDPNAGRFLRPSDLLPVRQEQIVNYLEISEEILELKEKDIISWEWIQIENINVDINDWSNSAIKFFERIKMDAGKKTLDVMRIVISWLSFTESCDMWQNLFSEKCHFRNGGSEIFVGRPYVDLELLDSLSCSQLIIAPHLSRRGPNGLWVITRGNNHPIDKQINGRGAYFLTNNKFPWIYEYVCEKYFENIRETEFFTSKEAAMDYIKENLDDDTDSEFEISYASGADFLKLFSCCDSILIDSSIFAITFEGASFHKSLGGEDVEISSIDYISSALASEGHI
jgi:hypothetical protein